MAGRPTEYKEEYIDAVDRYLERATRENMHLPKIESFALFIGVERKTLYNWEKTHPDFKKALNKIRTTQAERLIDDGIYGGKEVNATIVKLLLMNNHNMRDKSDVTTDDESINSFTDVQIKRIADRLARRKGSDDNSPGKK